MRKRLRAMKRINDEDLEALESYLEVLENENKVLAGKLKKIYDICNFRNGKDYKDAIEQIIDIEEVLGV